MKVQIAIIAGGLAIAAGVAYAELKPAGAPSVPATTQSSDPNANSTQPSQPQQQTQTQSQTKSAPSQTQPKLTNPNTKPNIPGGGDDHESGERHDGGERHEGGEDD